MSTSKNDRVSGVLVGQAVADALGMGYEFGYKPLQPGERAVMRSGAMFSTGHWTDDTEQAIVVALAGADPTAVADGLLGWINTGPRDVGISTRTVLGGAWNAQEVMDRSRRYGEFLASKPKRPGFLPGMANGSLMRTGPVALAHLDNAVALAKAAREVSDVTHYDPTGYTGDACVIWSVLISIAVHQGAGNFDLGPACQDAIGYIPQARQAFWTEVVTSELLRPGIPEGKNGSAVGAFKVALNAIAHTSSYYDAIQRAIGAGHDTDTTAAITGMLAGALYGMSGIPASWRNMVRGKAGPFPGYMLAGDLADLALCTASGWEFSVPQYALDYPPVSAYAKAGGTSSNS